MLKLVVSPNVRFLSLILRDLTALSKSELNSSSTRPSLEIILSLLFKNVYYQFIFFLPNVAPWCSGSTTDCCFRDLRLIPTSACWEVMMVRLPYYGPFWKFDVWVFVGLTTTQKQFVIIIIHRNASVFISYKVYYSFFAF